MRDYKGFKFLSDHEGDKIVYFYEGSFPTSDNTIEIPHTLGFAPLLIGYWSTNADFSDARPFSSIGLLDMEGNAIIDEVSCNAVGNDAIYVFLISKAGSYNRVYFRLFGFMPTDVDVSVPQTAYLTNGNFIFNTKYKYSKLFESGIANDEVTITHNFGYLPRVLAWDESGSGATRAVSQIGTGEPESDYYPDDRGIIVTDSLVTIRKISSGRIHYRIYYDEA